MSSSTPIRKAVIPAAGLGTRMLPVSKVVPKELLPVGGKPLIQYAIEEAIASGIEEIVVVSGPRKSWLETFLKSYRELAVERRARGKQLELESLDSPSSLGHITVVQQPVPLGLGDAVLCTQSVIGREPFAVILPDAVIDAPVPVLAQLMAAYEEYPGAFVATKPVEPRDFAHFGMLSLKAGGDIRRTTAPFRVLSIVEKPQPKDAPSNFGVFGRYLLMPEIFADLKRVATTAGGEVQLSDALATYCQRDAMYALLFNGKHYDAGDPFGYFQAVVEFALKNAETGPMIREYLSELLSQEPQQSAVVAISDSG